MLAGALAGCIDDVLLWQAPPPVAEMSPSYPAAADAGVVEDVVIVPRADYCAGHGSPVPEALLPEAAPACSHPSAQLFRRALCSCTDAAFSAAVQASASDSRAHTSGAAPLGADLGVNNQWVAAGAVEIHGGLTMGGAGLFPISLSPFDLAGTLRTAGGLSVSASNAHIGRELWVRGEVVLFASELLVDGDFYQPPDAQLPIGPVMIGGHARAQTFEIAPPCACGDRALDIAAIVTHGRAQAQLDNLGVPTGLLTQTTGTDPIELPCGRIALDPGSLQPVQLRVHGRTAVYIRGDLSIVSNFVPDFGDMGELDVFIDGSLAIAPNITIGSPTRAGALRFYVSGPADLILGEPTSLAAGLYAPNATLYTTGSMQVHGALFVESLYASGDVDLRYDAALLQPIAADTQDACSLMPNQACQSDGECPAPFVCQSGGCQLGLF